MIAPSGGAPWAVVLAEYRRREACGPDALLGGAAGGPGASSSRGAGQWGQGPSLAQLLYQVAEVKVPPILRPLGPTLQEGEMNPVERVLRHMEVPGEPGLFVVGCLERRVTLYSQQVRALNLVYALSETGRLKGGTKVAVIGGGAAGVTAAAAAARRGAHVTLLERHPTLLPLQRGNSSRWLHPHIYDWPEEGSQEVWAGLPLMNWKAGLAGEVVEQLDKEWESVLKSLPGGARINEPIHDVRSVDIGEGSPRTVSWVGKYIEVLEVKAASRLGLHDLGNWITKVVDPKTGEGIYKFRGDRLADYLGRNGFNLRELVEDGNELRFNLFVYDADPRLAPELMDLFRSGERKIRIAGVNRLEDAEITLVWTEHWD